MANKAPNCTKCLTDDHRSITCPNKWPIHSEQVCDGCGKPGHEFKDKNCPVAWKDLTTCKRCGHVGHKVDFCLIEDVTNDDHVNQYTKSKYTAVMNSRSSGKGGKSGKGTSAVADRTRQPGGKSNTTPGKGGFGASSRSSSSSKPKVVQTQQEIIKRLAQMKIEAREAPAPKPLTEKQQREKEWAKSNLMLSQFSTSGISDTKNILANLFRVEFTTTLPDIRKYRIELGNVNGKIPPKREVRRALIEQLLQQRPPKAKYYVTDYFSHIISIGKLYNEFSSNPLDAGFAYFVGHIRSGRSDDVYPEVHTFIHDEGPLQINKLKDYVDPKKPRDPTYFPDEDLKALNIISWATINRPGWPGGRVGKKFYPTEQVREFSGSLVESGTEVYILRTGFYTSMRPGNGSLMLNVNTTTSAFYPTVNLQVWIDARLNSASLTAIAKELKSIRVTFEGDNPQKNRVIHSIDKDPVSVVEFLNDKLEKYETVFNYMKRVHATINRPEFSARAKCVNLGGDTKAFWYPADKLRIVEWQPVRGLLTSFTDQMLKTATRTHALKHIGLRGGESIYKNFGLTVSSEFVTIYPRVLALPPLIFGDSKVGGLNRNRGAASWDMRDVPKPKGRGFFNTAKTQETLHVLRVGLDETQKAQDKQDNPWLGGFMPEFLPILQNYGLKFTKFKIGEAFVVHGKDPVLRRDGFKRNLDEAWAAFGRPPFMFVLLPWKNDNNDDIYSDLKWWADIDQGVHTVCVTPEKLKFDVTLLGNLALKINVKLGGINHVVNMAGLKDNTMVVGADVTHPGKSRDETCPSMAGVVASWQQNCVAYLPSARLQTRNTEYIEDLRGMMLERLSAFHKLRHAWPAHILFYRDGVSESQYGMVRDEELRQIREACADAKLTGNNRPSITLVIVAKRHHARFYPNAESHHGVYDKKQGKFTNLQPGIVVDTQVVAPKQFNFYLQSHDSPLGTAKSGHYVVLENESGYSAKVLQEITLKLAFLGSRAMHGLAACTPARYADILCTRLRAYMRPALDAQMLGKFGNGDVRDYERHNTVWGRNGSGGRNPWGSNMEERMFYL